MYLATLTLARGTCSDDNAASRGIYGLVATLRDFGRVCNGNWMVVSDGQAYRAGLNLPATDALRSDLWCPPALAELRCLRALGLGDAEVVILGRETDTHAQCSCPLRSSYILYTDFLTSESPLRCGTCFAHVPLYTVGRVGNFLDVNHWQHLYRIFDALYIDGTLEETAIRQLERLNSQLSRDGLEVCQSLSADSGLPVYYNLERLVSRTYARERKRRCPKCRGPWLLDNPWHGRFDFRCDGCQLVSRLESVDNFLCVAR